MRKCYIGYRVKVMELKEIIASRIKKLREMNGLSQAQLAKEIGTTQASVARYEKGIVFPQETHLLWYADRFNVSLDWIYGRTNSMRGGFLKKDLKEYMSDDVRKIIGEELEPGQNIYELIKERVGEMVEEMNKKSKKK